METSLLFASHNAHKVAEIRRIVGDRFIIKGLADMGFQGEVPEEQDTLQGNAEQKARYVYQLYGLPCFADDTGLEVTALHGAPGVYSARYGGVSGTVEEQSAANIRKLLAQLRGVTDRSARFRTVVCYFDGTTPHFFEGIVRGVLLDKEKGTAGFGYDPIFLPEGSSLTFAEMDQDAKNKISHRGKAFAEFIAYLNRHVA